MVAKEVREFRNTSKRLFICEEKGKLMLELRRKRVCLSEEEMFVQNLHRKFKVFEEKRG